MNTKWIAAAALSLLPVLTAWADSGQVFSTKSGAIRGYDPVAYHTEEKPVKGSKELTFEYNGATWRFSSEANLELFRNDPERYAPAYGGYCAFGMSRGYAVDTDPRAFSIVDGKLYLNHNLSVRRTWKKDIPGNIAKANANWPSVSAGL
ncbi:MAG: YHS domain-containing (seleno)protein [Pseudomonadota bacterium]